MNNNHWPVTGQGFAGAVLTAIFALWGVSFQLSHQDEQAERLRFIDGAQATAQETTSLLFEGFNSINNLVNSSDDKGWKEIQDSSWHEYYAFHQRWRERLIAEHFKLVRYFGKDLADQLIHVDEIDLHVVKNTNSTTPCSVPGGNNSIDIEKLASHVECVVRFSAVSFDVYEENITKNNDANQRIEQVQSRIKYSKTKAELLESYEKSIVRYIRSMDKIITQLGAPRVTTIPSKN